MKKIAYAFFVMVAVISFASCEREEEMEVTPAPISQDQIKFNFTVEDLDPETRAAKTGWANGDKINIWFDGNCEKTPDLVLYYNGTSWDAGELREGVQLSTEGGQLAALFETQNDLSRYAAEKRTTSSNQTICTFSYNQDYKVDENGNYPVVTPASMVVRCNQIDYSIVGTTVTANITGWSFINGLQVSITGLPDGDYALCSSIGAVATDWLVYKNKISTDLIGFNNYSGSTSVNKEAVFYFYQKNSSDQMNVSATFTLIPKIDGAFSSTNALTYSTTIYKLKKNGSYQAAKIAHDKFKIQGRYGVDMGNGLMWATVNLGSSSETGFGDYYAWGETAPKSEYTSDNNTYTSTYPSLVPGHDAATVSWGGSWHIPTRDEWAWLKDNCTWTWTTNYSGTSVSGYIGTSKINGNKIFLPATGNCSGTSVIGAGSYGRYWSSTYGSPFIPIFTFNNLQTPGIGNMNRWVGVSIRPVFSALANVDYEKVVSVSLDKSALSLGKGSSDKLTATVLPENAMYKTLTWSSSNSAVATVDENGIVTGVAEGFTTITATSDDGGLTAKCLVEVLDPRDDFNPDTYLLYRKNTVVDDSGGNYYSTDTNFPGISGSKVELKFQLTGPDYISSGNMNSDYYDYVAIESTQFVWNEKYKEDGDWYDDEWTCPISSATDLLLITFDGINQKMRINGQTFSCNRSVWSMPQLFATYDHESDEGIYQVYGGIPDDSKLYYAKAWDSNGILNQFSYATTAVNPKTNKTEYCWCSYYPKTGNVAYTFANDAVNQGGFEGFTYN